MQLPDLFSLWINLPSDDRRQIRKNVYSMETKQIPQIGGLQILSERGIRNSCNNCWSNSAFHLLCGTALSSLLPSYNSCSTIVCQSLLKIKEKLQKQNMASTPLKFTSNMRAIISYFRNRDQKEQSHQDDGASLVEEILLHLIDNSIDDIEGYFQTKI